MDLGISCCWSGFLLSSLLIFLLDNDVGFLQGLTVFAEKRIRNNSNNIMNLAWPTCDGIRDFKELCNIRKMIKAKFS